MTSSAASSSPRTDAFLPRFLPLALITGLGLSAMGAPLSTLPRYIQNELGFGPVVVGLMIGLEPAATLLTRAACGKLSDRRGPKVGMLAGLAAAALSGVAYLLPLHLPVSPLVALAILALGRLARYRAAPRSRRARPFPPRLAVAHRQRFGPARRGGRRHVEKPQARIHRLPGDG